MKQMRQPVLPGGIDRSRAIIVDGDPAEVAETHQALGRPRQLPFDNPAVGAPHLLEPTL
jgi:hypothetical protein